MKAKKRNRGYVTILLFALAATLLIFSTVGTSRAALTYYSTTYGAEVQLQDIGITLEENNKPVDTRNYLNNDQWEYYQVRRSDNTTETIPKSDRHQLLLDMLKVKDENGDPTGGEEELKIGKAYPEVLTAYNSGNIPVYLRMTIYRYWLDQDGQERRTDLSPDLIDLKWSQDVSDNGGTAWLHDTNASTKERDVFYYTGILPVGQRTAPVTETLTITGLDGVQFDVTQTVEETKDGKIYTTTYTYAGATFVVEATVDAVQTHNAVDAIKSAWGVNVALDGSKQIAGLTAAPARQPETIVQPEPTPTAALDEDDKEGQGSNEPTPAPTPTAKPAS